MKLIFDYSYDFTNGIQVSPKELDNWKKEIIKNFESHDLIKGAAFHIHRSGNSAIIAVASSDNSLQIFEISNGYKVHNYNLLPNSEQDVQVSDTTKAEQRTK